MLPALVTGPGVTKNSPVIVIATVFSHSSFDLVTENKMHLTCKNPLHIFYFFIVKWENTSENTNNSSKSNNLVVSLWK